MASTKWKLKRVVQCAKCPWKQGTDPTSIGYDKDRHHSMAKTIAEPGSIAGIMNVGDAGIPAGGFRLDVMGCHEDEHETPCIGWLVNQIGDGNNIPLRISMMTCENAREMRTVGPQHETFDDMLPED
jgi:hypothetical protein